MWKCDSLLHNVMITASPNPSEGVESRPRSGSLFSRDVFLVWLCGQCWGDCDADLFVHLWVTAVTSSPASPLPTTSVQHLSLGCSWCDGRCWEAWVLTESEEKPTVSKVLSGAAPVLFRETSPSTFFTMLTFSHILNIYLQWMAALSRAIVCKVESDWPTYGKSSCQYNHDMAPSCTLIIPYRLSIRAQFSCQSWCIICPGVREGLKDKRN